VGSFDKPGINYHASLLPMSLYVEFGDMALPNCKSVWEIQLRRNIFGGHLEESVIE
jgi:hypothetical protein